MKPQDLIGAAEGGQVVFIRIRQDADPADIKQLRKDAADLTKATGIHFAYLNHGFELIKIDQAEEQNA